MALVNFPRKRRKKQYGAILGSAIAGGIKGYAEAKQRKKAGEAAAATETRKRYLEEREFAAGQDKLSRSESQAEKDRQLRLQESEADRAFKAGEAEKGRAADEKLFGLKLGEGEKERAFRATEGEKERAAAEKLTRIREASQGPGAERKPFEFEARTTRIKSSLFSSTGEPLDFDQTPLRFAMMAIAKKLANKGIDPEHADFRQELLEELKAEFPEEDRIDHGLMAEYMLRNSKELPWKDMDEETKGKIRKGWEGFARMFLTRKAEEFYGIAPKPQTIEDLINERLK